MDKVSRPQMARNFVLLTHFIILVADYQGIITHFHMVLGRDSTSLNKFYISSGDTNMCNSSNLFGIL
jgi:hypothetical protein